MKDLTGTWTCQGDGLTYYLTQIGNDLYFTGVGKSTTNVGFGIINPNEASIVAHWADTPNSNGMGNHGVLFLDASQDDKIVKKAGSQNYGIGNFVKKV
jgi:hypothetical protein